MHPTAIQILREIESNAGTGQLFTMFTEFTKDNRMPLSEVIDAIEDLLHRKLVTPRFPYPGMQRISVAITDKGRDVLAELQPPAAEAGRPGMTA